MGTLECQFEGSFVVTLWALIVSLASRLVAGDLE